MSLCDLCIATGKHFVSSLQINALDSNFQLIHITNILMLIVLTPPCLPYTPFINCANLFANYVNSYIDYGNTSINCTNKFNDCVNTPDDRVNIFDDSPNTHGRSSLDLWIPNPSLL